MRKMHVLGRIVSTAIFIAIVSSLAMAQESDLKKYAKNGVAFDFLDGWEATDQAGAGSQQISLANKETDSQILVIVLNQKIKTKDPLPELKKRVVDPWVTQLVHGYIENKIPLEQSPATTEIASQQAEGVRLKFFLDNQPGAGEAYWVLLDNRLVLTYFIRPDKTSEKAVRGWDVIRKSLHVETVKK
jgi:hypothetical protein